MLSSPHTVLVLRIRHIKTQKNTAVKCLSQAKPHQTELVQVYVVLSILVLVSKQTAYNRKKERKKELA